jgi:hypothetical protein
MAIDRIEYRGYLIDVEPWATGWRAAIYKIGNALSVEIKATDDIAKKSNLILEVQQFIDAEIDKNS